MRAIEAFAFIDENGNIMLESSVDLKNKKVKLLILIDEDEEAKEFYALSSEGLSQSYSTDEPEYDLSLVKEPNPHYEGR